MVPSSARSTASAGPCHPPPIECASVVVVVVVVVFGTVVVSGNKEKNKGKLESVRRCQNSLVLVVLAICIMISADAGFLRTFPRTAFKADNDVATECLGDGWHCGVTRSRLISHSVTIYARHISR